MNVIANIGDKMKLSTNYNTEATFDFENRMKIEYTGYEDDIIKKIEAGNVTFPINSQLIQGSQSLFGIKTQLQFGRLMVTSVYSQQRGQARTIDVQGGAQTTNFDIRADQYESNRHFFLAQYFRNNYDRALRDLNRLQTNIIITRIEVWVTSRTFVASQNLQNRNIVAFADLGENNPDTTQSFIPGFCTQFDIAEPSDSSNGLYPTLGTANLTALRQVSNSSSILDPLGIPFNFSRNKNFETVENARLLQPNEYTLNSRLGYISLNTTLEPNQVLAVAFEYTANGMVHRVGELTANNTGTTGTEALFVKTYPQHQLHPEDLHLGPDDEERLFTRRLQYLAGKIPTGCIVSG